MNWVYAYVVIGIVVASLPLVTPGYSDNYNKFNSRAIIVGCTTVLIFWPLVFIIGIISAFKEVFGGK